jgi:hypothetical protein
MAWMRRRSCASRTTKTRVSRLSQIRSSPRVIDMLLQEDLGATPDVQVVIVSRSP